MLGDGLTSWKPLKFYVSNKDTWNYKTQSSCRTEDISVPLTSSGVWKRGLWKRKEEYKKMAGGLALESWGLGWRDSSVLFVYFQVLKWPWNCGHFMFGMYYRIFDHIVYPEIVNWKKKICFLLRYGSVLAHTLNPRAFCKQELKKVNDRSRDGASK